MTTEIDTLEKKFSEDDVSVCDIMKSNTSTIINKIESQIPTLFQMQSDVYKEYLHSIEDLFGTCFISEKEFFEKLNLDQNALKFFDNYWKNATEMCLSQIDIATNFLRTYSQMRISTIKSFDSYMHMMMEYYAKMLAEFNSSLGK